MTNIKLQEGTIDSHCHLADKRIALYYEQFLARALSNNITTFLQAGVDPMDWQKQLELQLKHPKHLLTSFGIHPYYIIQSAKTDFRIEFEQLLQLLPNAFAIGEYGLDFRKSFIEPNKNVQLECFQKHIQIANDNEKVSVLHLVQSHDVACQILKKTPLKQPAMVHSFNSNFSVAKKYLNLGFYLSIGAPCLRVQNHHLIDSIRKTPNEFLLLESDTPDQAPPNWKQEWNEPSSILLVAEKIASIKNLMLEDVLSFTRQNFIRLFSRSLQP